MGSRRRSTILWRCWNAVAAYLLGPHFQLGLQLAAGILLTSLPVFVRALRFPHACFASVLMVIGLVSMSPDGAIGTKLLAAYQLIGQALLGALTAGAMVSIAKPLAGVHQGAYIAVLCVTTCIGLALLTSARAGPQPITLWPNITIACLNFAVVVLWSQSSPTLAAVWANDVGGMLACGVSAAVAVGLVSTCLLPTLATEEVVRLTSSAVRGSGHSLSRYLSLLLDTSAVTQQHSHPDQAHHFHQQEQQRLQPPGSAAAPAGPEGRSPEDAGRSSTNALAHADSGSSSVLVDARDLPSSSAPNSPGPVSPAAAASAAVQGSEAVVLAPEHAPVQLLPLPHTHIKHQHQHQQQHQHQHHKPKQHNHHHLEVDTQLTADQQQQQQQQQEHHQDHHAVHLHRGQHALHIHERHHHPHAAVLPTPYGPVAVLGPSVDELRQLLLVARTALGRGAYEPPWVGAACGACSGAVAGGVSSPRADAATWRELLAAAEQLINVVSTLQDVLVFASPRLLHPSTAIGASWASFSSTAQAVMGLTINSTAQLAQVLLMPEPSVAALDHRPSLASASWSAARAELEAARGAAVQHYWSTISSNSGKLVAASSEALAVMFVWVAVGGVMTAVERLDVAGSRLMGPGGSEQPGGRTDSTASAGSAVFSGDRGLGRSSLLFSRRPSKLGLQASHLHLQHTQQDEQQQERQQRQQQAVASRRSVTPEPPLPRHNPQLQQPPTTAKAAAAAVAQHWRQALWQLISALLLLPVLHNIAGFWAAQCSKLLACFRPSQDPAQGGTPHRSWWHRLSKDRSAAAALKLWLGMGGLVVLFILVAENPGGSIHPTVAAAVMTVPTHGVVALVLAWHERVESTIIRVTLRIVGTAAGATVGWAAHHATSDPVLLALIMCVAGLLIAPLASASFHFRLATALTVISMCVVVLCQFDPASETSRATDRFYGTRVVEVTIACLWTAFLNKALLPWSSRDWALEQISGAVVSGSDVLCATSELQFAAAAPAASSVPQPAGGSSSGSGHTQPPKSQLAAGLVAKEAALQKRVVEPMVAVQTALSLETHVFGQRSAPGTLPKALKTLVREMLLMADRLTAVQVAVAALPQSAAGKSGSDNTKVSVQLLGPSDAAQSIEFVVGALMQPLHRSHVLQLQLVAAVAVAVKEVLLEPSAETQGRLRHCVSQLEWEKARGRSLVASLRKQLHHDVMQVKTDGADGVVRQQQLSADPAENAEQQLVYCISAAMSSDGVLPMGEGVGESADAAQHVSRWWWQHAGDYYCQCLAFQYAFDSAVAGFLAVAVTALRL